MSKDDRVGSPLGRVRLAVVKTPASSVYPDGPPADTLRLQWPNGDHRVSSLDLGDAYCCVEQRFGVDIARASWWIAHALCLNWLAKARKHLDAIRDARAAT